MRHAYLTMQEVTLEAGLAERPTRSRPRCPAIAL